MASKKLGNVLGSTLKMIKADRKIYPKEKIPTITRESFCFFKTLRIIVIFLEWRMTVSYTHLAISMACCVSIKVSSSKSSSSTYFLRLDVLLESFLTIRSLSFREALR